MAATDQIASSGAPRVSVIMTAYQDLRFIDAAVRSILAQTYTDFELIVFDDGNGAKGHDVFARLAALEVQSLFSGEYDEKDAVVELHAGAGGTDAQDWTEMMLRMYLRWAERRNFSVEVDETTPGQPLG